MARRQQRRPIRRPPAGARRPDEAAAQAMLDASARRLLVTHDGASLEGLVHDLGLLRDEADRTAYEQPSPQALSTFRRVSRELAVAQRALGLVEPER